MDNQKLLEAASIASDEQPVYFGGCDPIEDNPKVNVYKRNESGDYSLVNPTQDLTVD